MQTNQGNMLQSLRTVQAFLEENAAELTDVVNTGARQRLDDAIAELSVHVSDQTGSALASQGATLKQYTLRRALLRDHMAPISRIARSDLPQTPEIEPFKMPRGRPTTEKLCAAAFGMAKAATPFAGVFIAAGLPTDFVARLEAAASALVDSVSDRAQSRGKRSGATKGLKSQLAGGRKIVHILDAFVKSALKDDPALLANWYAVKRVRKFTGRTAATSLTSTLPGAPISSTLSVPGPVAPSSTAIATP
ncbi:MAG: hypothetical protein JWL61_4191 [Gemmatimonadetes bacterium]|nr:hypothetical protein [Gemmatimonadota bacterium]